MLIHFGYLWGHDMAKSLDFENGVHRDEFASFIREVERVLAQYDDAVKAHNSISSGVVTSNVGATTNLILPTHQQAIHGDLARLASEFVHALAAKAVRRFEISTSPTICAPAVREPATLEAPNQKDGLESLSIENWAGPVAGSTYLEDNFCIPRSTLHWWQRRNYVVALRKGARKHVFPLAQFIDGRPAPGIREVLSLIAHPRLAWLWLIRPSPHLDGRVPIEMLRQDLVAEVVSAARLLLEEKPN